MCGAVLSGVPSLTTLTYLTVPNHPSYAQLLQSEAVDRGKRVALLNVEF